MSGPEKIEDIKVGDLIVVADLLYKVSAVSYDEETLDAEAPGGIATLRGISLQEIDHHVPRLEGSGHSWLVNPTPEQIRAMPVGTLYSIKTPLMHVTMRKLGDAPAVADDDGNVTVKPKRLDANTSGQKDGNG